MSDRPVVLLVTATPKPGCLSRAGEILVEASPAVRAHDGCLRYAHHLDGTGRLVTIEKWRDQNALDAHAAHPDTAVMVARLRFLLAGPPEIVVLHPLPGAPPGDPTYERTVP